LSRAIKILALMIFLVLATRVGTPAVKIWRGWRRFWCGRGRGRSHSEFSCAGSNL